MPSDADRPDAAPPRTVSQSVSVPPTVDLDGPTPQDRERDDRSFTFSDVTAGFRVHPPRMPETTRQSVPGFEILKELGRGGMGVVYQARQQGLNRLVALKMILSGAHASEAERERFRREAEAVAQLRHPNIVQIHDIGEVDECPYLAFEYIDGGTLADQLTGDPWPAKQAASTVETLARAMDYAHGLGIVHRDLKPGNILLSRESGIGNRESGKSNEAETPDASSRFPIPDSRFPKITDFGLAKRVVTGQTPTGDSLIPLPGERTRTGAVMGTPSYLSPEQAAGKNREVGPASDVYSLGAILYELLTGRPPFKGETPLDTVLQVMNDDPVAPSRLQPKVPRDLETVCMKCLQKLPGRRYESAAELADDLARFQRGEPIHARPVGNLERLVKWARRHPTTASLGLFSATVVLILLTVSIYFNFQLKQANRQTLKEATEAKRLQEEAEKERNRTKEANDRYEATIKEVEKKRLEVIRQEEINRRGEYALRLSQASFLAERDPRRAIDLLTDRRVRNEYRDFTWNYLKRLCNRELHVWKDDAPRPIQGISSAHFSPDGSLVASACWDSAVRLYNPQSFKPIAVLRASGGLMLCVTFSPDGRTVAASGDDGRIHLWEVPHRSDNDPPEVNPFAVLKGHRGAVKALAFSPKSHLLVSGGDDGDLRFWSVPPSPAAGGILLGSSSTLMTRVDPEVKEWMAFTPTVRTPIPVEGHGKGIWAIAFNPEGDRLFTGGEDKTVRVWDLKPMPKDSPTSEILNLFRDPIISLSFAEHGSQELLAVAGNSRDDPSIRVWDVQEKREVLRLRGHTQSINSVSFSPDGGLLLSGGADRSVRLWDVRTGQEKMLLRGHDESVRSVAFSPTQPLVVSGDLQQHLVLWSLAPQREETHDLPNTAGVDSAALSRDGTRLAVGEKGGLIRVWRTDLQAGPTIPTHGELHLKGHRTGVIRLAFSRDGETLVSASVDGDVRIWDLRRKAVVNAQGIGEIVANRPQLRSPSVPRGLALVGDRLIVGGERGVRVFDLKGGAPPHDVPIQGRFLRAMAVSGDEQKLATTNGRILQFWNLKTFELECTRMLNAFQSSEVMGLAFEPLELDPHRPGGTGWRLISTDDKGSGKMWDVTPTEGVEGSSAEKLSATDLHDLSGHGEPIESLAFTPNGKTLVTGSRDRTIKCWDPLTGADRGTLTGHAGGVVLVTFLPGTRALLSVGREGAVKLWKAE